MSTKKRRLEIAALLLHGRTLEQVYGTIEDRYGVGRDTVDADIEELGKALRRDSAASPWTLLEAAQRITGQKPDPSAWLEVQQAATIGAGSKDAMAVVAELRVFEHLVGSGQLAAVPKKSSFRNANSGTVMPADVVALYREMGRALPKGLEGA